MGSGEHHPGPTGASRATDEPGERVSHAAGGATGLGAAEPVAVVGAGAMGRGIAEVALLAGHPVRLYDAAAGTVEQAFGSLRERLDRHVSKGRLSADQSAAALARLVAPARLTELADSSLVVEAVVEDAVVKRGLLGDLEAVVSDDCLLATNTSSLSVTRLAGALRRPGRLVGLHFFNPAPLLPLVEVVSGAATEERYADLAHDTVAAWGKTPVRCADTPGFLVNRVARPFYAEPLRVHEEGAAEPATIDAVVRESGGFRMGPFELTDLIGQDVNEAVTRAVWESFHYDPKFTPSLAQRRLVEAGALGRKTGQGWYDHLGTEPAVAHTAAPCEAPAAVVLHGDLGPAAVLSELVADAGVSLTDAGPDGRPDAGGYLELPGGVRLSLTDGAAATTRTPGEHIVFDLALDYRSATRVALAPSDTVSPEALGQAVGLFQALGKRVSVIADVPGLIVARTVAMVVDFATDVVGRGVASAADVDVAVRLGANYPRGPLEWGSALGAEWVCTVLHHLHRTYPTGRYAASPRLLRRAAARRDLF